MTACANASAWNRERLIILVHALGDVRLADAIRQLRRYCARRDHRGADVVGFDFLAQPFGEGPHGVLGGRVDRSRRGDGRPRTSPRDAGNTNQSRQSSVASANLPRDMTYKIKGNVSSSAHWGEVNVSIRI